MRTLTLQTKDEDTVCIGEVDELPRETLLVINDGADMTAAFLSKEDLVELSEWIEDRLELLYRLERDRGI